MTQIKSMLNKYKNLSLPVKAALWFTICSITQKGISFITVPIFTRLLTVEEYGLYSVYNSWLSLFTIIATFKMYSGSYFNGLFKFKEQKEAFTSCIQTLETVITITVFGIVAVLNKQLNPLLGLSSIFIIMMMIKILITPPIEFWMTEQRVNYNYRSLVFLTLSIAIFNPLLGILGIVFTKSHHAEMRVLGGLVIYIILGLFFYIRNIFKGRKLFHIKYWSFALKFDAPLLPHNLALSILGQSDRIMINNMVGASEAAIYSLAYSVSMTLQIVKDAIRDALLPWIYTKLEKKAYREIHDVINVILIFVSLVSFLFIAFAPEVIAIMGSKDYYEAIWIMPPVASSLYFMFLYNIFSSIEFYYEKTNYAMVASVVSAALNIVLNFIFIKIFGYIAAGYTTLFCYIALAGTHYFMAVHVMEKQGERFELVNKRFILFYSSFVIVFSCVFTYIYKYTFARYCIILLFIAAIFIERKKFVFLWMEFKQAKKDRNVKR